MKSKAIVSALVALSMASGGLTFAQGNSDQNDRGRNEQSQRGGQQNHRDDRGRSSARSQDQGRANNDQRPDERGAGPDHAFHKGQRLPIEYRSRSYVVDDWRGHQLNAPPRGYHWVQTGGDYVLVAITTGIILQLLLNH